MTRPPARRAYGDTVAETVRTLVTRYGLAHARALASVHATQSVHQIDRAHWAAVLDSMDTPTIIPPPNPTPEPEDPTDAP